VTILNIRTKIGTITGKFSGNLRLSPSAKCLIGLTTDKTPRFNLPHHQINPIMRSLSQKRKLKPIPRWCLLSTQIVSDQTLTSKWRYLVNNRNPKNRVKSLFQLVPQKLTKWRPTLNLCKTKLKIFRTSSWKLMTFMTLRLVYRQVGCPQGRQIKHQMMIKKSCKILDLSRYWTSIRSKRGPMKGLNGAGNLN
jgi:hypothetical protein